MTRGAPSPNGRSRVLPGLLLGLVATLVVPATCRADKVKDSEELNYFLKVPDRWNFGRESDFAKQSVVAVADCLLELLADGKTPGTGQGARVMLSVQDVPKDFEPDYETWLYEYQMLVDKTKDMQEIPEELAVQISAAREKLEKPLEALAGRPDVQSLLLGRWEKDLKKQPHMEPDAKGVNIGHIPAAQMKYAAPCANLSGNDGECEGRLFVWVIRKRLYRMAMWMWPNKYDRERVRDDLDQIEFNYETPKPTAIPRKMPPPDKVNDPNEPKANPELAKEALHRDPAFQFELMKVARFLAQKLDRSRADQKHLGYRMDGSAGAASCIFELLVYPVKNATEPFNIDTYLVDFWSMFLKSHPNGKLEAAPFPIVTQKVPFLSLPDFAKKHEVPRPEKKPGKPDKEEKLSRSDLEQLGVVGEVKAITIGKQRVKNTWRLCLLGNAERAGDEVNIQYIFQTPDFCYVLRIVCRRDGIAAFKESIAKILASIVLTEPPK